LIAKRFVWICASSLIQTTLMVVSDKESANQLPILDTAYVTVLTSFNKQKAARKNWGCP
jgi:hypothetical protein